MSKTTKVVLGIVVIVLIIWGIASSNKKAENDTIKIGGLYILTGPIAQVGELEKNATTIAVDKINSTGGISGKKLEVIQEDTAYDPKKTISAYQNVKLKGAKFFIADGSGPVAAIRKPVIDDGNFVIAAAATTPVYFDGENRTCRISLTAKNFGPGLADLLVKNNYKSVSFLLPDNEYGKGLAQAFTDAYTAKGGQIRVSEFYDTSPGAGDYRTNITKVKGTQSTTDALVFVQATNTIEPMLKQIHQLGWTKPLISDFYTIENPALKDMTLANDIQYVTYQYSKEPQSTDSDKVKEFKDEYYKRYGVYPIYTAAATYDTIMIMADAIAHVGYDPKKVGDYVSSLKDYHVITGSLTFNNDCEVSRTAAFAKINDGKVVEVK